MKKLIILIIICFPVIAFAQCVTNVDFNTWSKAGNPSNGNWVVQGGGSQVRQTINGGNTYFISPFDLMNVRVTGNFRSTDNDDDWMGFVFSFLDPIGSTNDYDCWLFDWKQEYQGASPRGMSLNRVLGNINNYAPFSNHQNTAEFTVVQNNFGSPGWVRNFNHAFELRLTYTRATIYVDGNLVFDYPDCYKPGRFGFYNLSQEDCYYSNFQYDLFIDFFVDNDGKICLGDTADFEFVNPCINANLSQYQSLTWNFGDGSPPVVNNNPTFANANLKYRYQAAGNYTATLTVLDNNGCSSTATRNIEVRSPINLTPVLNQPPCNGGLNGSVSVNPSGGFGNFSYSWNGGVNTLQTWFGVPAGTYIVNVTDGICSTDGQFTLNQPSALTATTSHTDASCGQSNGTATINISGGTPPYQNISWAGVAGNPGTGLAAGMYIANFNDANGCSALLQYRETVAALPCGVNTSVTKTNVTCFSGNNGSITLTVTGGAANPSVTWSNGGNGTTINGLFAGTYTYNYSDAVPGNSFSGTVTITQPGAAMVANLVTTPISCAGSNDGTAIASVQSGGTSPYSYAWSGAQPNNPVAQNLSPGPISVIITDALGCTANASGNVSGIASLVVNITTTIDSCFNSGKGSARATVTGGNPPYDFAWNNFYTEFDNKNLRGGTYTVTVTDNKNCSVTASGIVGGPSTPLVYTYAKQDIDCFGDNTGDFNINTTGGTPGYTIVWDAQGVSGFNPTGLVAGAYNYTITDGYGCIVYGGDTIFQSEFPLSAVTSHTDVTCFGSSDGAITLTIDGGTPPYTYLGNPIPAGTTTIPNLAAGYYSGIVLDANSCSVAVSETITEPNAQNINVTGTDNPCFGATQGTATTEFVNPTGTVLYEWSNGQSGATVSGLSAGNYIVTATDQNNCVLTGSIDIVQPVEVIMTVDVIDALCFGTDGTATASPVGGTAPYNFSWSSGGSGQTINLPAGNYTVTATDAATCQQIASLIINEPSEIVVQAQVVDVSCFGGNSGAVTLTANGGAGGYDYTWNPNVGSGNSAANLPAVSYEIEVTDANSCSTIFSTTITEPTSLGLTATATDVSCFGGNSGTIASSVAGGVSPFSYALFENGVNNQTSATGQFSTLVAVTYTVVVTDANACLDSTTIIINEPNLLAATGSSIDVSCFGYSDGQITVTASRGVPTYIYAISTNNQNANGNFTALSIGNYTITITDANNCETTTTATIEQPDAVLVTIAPDSATISFGETILLEVITNLNGTVTYLWQPSTDLSCSDCANPEFIGSNTTQYTVTSVNESGCSGSNNILIAVVPNYTIYIPNAFTPNGDGINDTWKIFGNIAGLVELEVLIFDRWGEKIFAGDLANYEWDGIHKGKLLNPSVYVWHVKTEFLDGYTKNFKGSLTLVK